MLHKVVAKTMLHIPCFMHCFLLGLVISSFVSRDPCIASSFHCINIHSSQDLLEVIRRIPYPSKSLMTMVWWYKTKQCIPIFLNLEFISLNFKEILSNQSIDKSRWVRGKSWERETIIHCHISLSFASVFSLTPNYTTTFYPFSLFMETPQKKKYHKGGRVGRN